MKPPFIQCSESELGQLGAHQYTSERRADQTGLIAACKGNPDLLGGIGQDNEEETASNITPLTAKA